VIQCLNIDFKGKKKNVEQFDFDSTINLQVLELSY